MLGSARITVTRSGQRIVASGDGARVTNAPCAPCEPVPCDTFITEATVALPVFKHPDPAEEMTKLLASVRAAPERAHLRGLQECLAQHVERDQHQEDREDPLELLRVELMG